MTRLCLYVKVHGAYLCPQVHQQYTHTHLGSATSKKALLVASCQWLVVFEDNITIIKRGLEVRISHQETKSVRR